MKDIKRTIYDPSETEETFECENCGNPVSKHSSFKCLKCGQKIILYLKAKGIVEYPPPIIFNKITK